MRTSIALGLTVALWSGQSDASVFTLQADGAAVIGADTTITTHFEDTLLDIARQYSLGYDEIIRANPGVDMWLPGEGRQIVLPGRRILPPGPREGIVVSIPEHRLYYFPSRTRNEPKVVITYPVSIGKLGRNTPLGRTSVIAKVEHPSWYPTASILKEHADAGDPLPVVVPPGPDNPLGDYKIRLGFGNGTYEIHGTNNPAAVGLAITHGCIRMYPEDVAELFKQLPVGTPVRLVNVPVKVAWIGGELLLEAHPPVNARGEAFEPSVDQFSNLLRAAVGNTTVAINWDYAREVLRKADGVIATVGLEAENPSARSEDASGRDEDSSKFSRDEDDPAGLSHCAQLDVRRYAQRVARQDPHRSGSLVCLEQDLLEVPVRTR